MSAPTRESVESYYDERIEGKLRDFTQANPRIEAAVQALAEWAPPNPKRILEIGCGIGATAWRMARAWPHAEVIGADISPASIQVARACFHRRNLSFSEGLVTELTINERFDFVVLMDVYEHIAVPDRLSLHASIRRLLGDEGRVFMSFPTPALQRYGNASDLQPVDEDVTIEDVTKFAEEADLQLLYYRIVGIWRYGDYAHAVLGRYRVLEDVALRQQAPGWTVGLKRKVKRLLIRAKEQTVGQYDYLGSDVLRPSARGLGRHFDVSTRERQRLASLWFARSQREHGYDNSRTLNL